MAELLDAMAKLALAQGQKPVEGAVGGRCAFDLS